MLNEEAALALSFGKAHKSDKEEVQLVVDEGWGEDFEIEIESEKDGDQSIEAKIQLQ